MFIYSQTVLSFISRIKSYIREIFAEEIKLPFYRQYFQYGRYRIPLNVVVFERKNVLGFFDYHTYQLGLHKSLMYSAKIPVIKNVLRHELAHLLAYLEYGRTIQDHGKEFQEICRKYGWGPEVSLATTKITEENEQIEGDLNSEKIISKVQKLLQLSSSANPHEAELATLKANQLLLKYNLECLEQSLKGKEGIGGEMSKDKVKEAEEQTYVERVLESKRNNAKMQAISEILQSFFVYPVFNYGKSIVYLEVTGNKTNVEIARYVATFLDREIESLWQKYKKIHPELKGLTGRNSFILGMAKGYVKKREEMKQQMEREGTSNAQALVLLAKDLQKKVDMVYRSLSRNSTSRSHCEEASQLGQAAGRQLQIHPGLSHRDQDGSSSSTRSSRLLEHN